MVCRASMWCCFSTLWTSPLSARQRSQRSPTAMETSRAKTQRYKKCQHDIRLSARAAFMTGGNCDAIKVPRSLLKMELLDAEPCWHCRSWACQWTHLSRTLPGFRQVHHTLPALSLNFPAVLQFWNATFCAASALLLAGNILLSRLCSCS